MFKKKKGRKSRKLLRYFLAFLVIQEFVIYSFEIRRTLEYYYLVVENSFKEFNKHQTRRIYRNSFKEFNKHQTRRIYEVLIKKKTKTKV